MHMLLKSLLLVASLSACTTYVERKVSADFKPVVPVEEVVPASSMAPTGAIFRGGMSGGLFANDNKARRVGDILTVLLMEDNRASKTQSVISDRTSDLALNFPSLTRGKDNGGLRGGIASEFEGVGEAEQSNSVIGEVSVMVVRQFNNGNLEVKGQKKLTLNNGDEYVRVSGIVRPRDISPTNVVNSNRLANADITYVGAGDVSDSGQQGWFSRVLNTTSPF